MCCRFRSALAKLTPKEIAGRLRVCIGSICALLLSFFYSDSVFATPTDTELWMMLATRISLDESKLYSFYLETQPRLGDDLQRASTVQIRAAINRRLGSNWEASLGYAWTPFLYDAEYRSIFRDENRSCLIGRKII